MNTNQILPKDITKDSDNKREFASFSYYDGIHLAKQNNWKQITTYINHLSKNEFIVCCGDVIIEVQSTDYPEIERRIL